MGRGELQGHGAVVDVAGHEARGCAGDRSNEGHTEVIIPPLLRRARALVLDPRPAPREVAGELHGCGLGGDTRVDRGVAVAVVVPLFGRDVALPTASLELLPGFEGFVSFESVGVGVGDVPHEERHDLVARDGVLALVEEIALQDGVHEVRQNDPAELPERVAVLGGRLPGRFPFVGEEVVPGGVLQADVDLDPRRVELADPLLQAGQHLQRCELRDIEGLTEPRLARSEGGQDRDRLALGDRLADHFADGDQALRVRGRTVAHLVGGDKGGGDRLQDRLLVPQLDVGELLRDKANDVLRERVVGTDDFDRHGHRGSFVCELLVSMSFLYYIIPIYIVKYRIFRVFGHRKTRHFWRGCPRD